MKSSAFFVALTDSSWFAARASDETVEVREAPLAPAEPSAAEGAAPAQTAAERLAAALAELGWRGQAVCLGLPSSLVHSAPLAAAALPRKNRQTALLYLLEEELPIEAERLTADFLPVVAGRSFGVAVETERVRPILADLAAAGVQVECLCPTALLAAWTACHESDFAAQWLLVADGRQWELLRIADRRPVAWYSLPPEPEELARCLGADAINSAPGADSPTLAVLGEMDEPTVQRIERESGVAVCRAAVASPLEAAARAAARRLAGQPAGWIDLRRNGLAVTDLWRRLLPLLRAAALLGLVLLATVAGLATWRAARYAQLADELESRQAALHRKLHPDSPVPASVRDQLKSEAARLAARTGEGQALPPQPSALETFRAIATGLPTELRCRVTSLQIAPTAVTLEGQASTHGDAEKVAQALRRAGLEVETPSTEQLARGGVAFNLSAKPADEPLRVPAPGEPR